MSADASSPLPALPAPVTYKLSHLTSYSYGAPVLLCHNVLHLCPRNSRWQRVISRSLEITPAPVSVSSRTDFFGNTAEYFSLDQPHAKLAIESKALVEVCERKELGESVTLEELGRILSTDTPPAGEGSKSTTLVKNQIAAQLISARQYLYDSPRVSTSVDLKVLAHEAFDVAGFKQPLDVPVHKLMLALCAHIHRTFSYQPGTTDVSTPLETALRARAGVCQDFAHIFIGAARSIGMPARYVSGYRHTLPPEGQTQRLVGADATHAWVSVFVPSMQPEKVESLSDSTQANGAKGIPGVWFDLDPTSGQAVSNQHIALGHARDYDDLPPVRGIELGGGLSTLSVSVDMTPVE